MILDKNKILEVPLNIYVYPNGKLQNIAHLLLNLHKLNFSFYAVF